MHRSVLPHAQNASAAVETHHARHVDGRHVDALQLDELTAIRGRPLFSPVTLRLAPGTLLGVVGPNGSGKSSLLSAIAGTGVPRSGQVRFGDHELSKLPSRRRAAVLALMTQDSISANELRALDVVRIGAHAGTAGSPRAAGATGAGDAGGAAGQSGTPTARAYQALADLDIADLADRVCSTLSGGQRQLVQVARVLAQNSPVMLLDEPTSALDLGHQLAVMHALQARAAAGHIVIVTMHDLTQALRWSTLLALVAGGRVDVGPPSEVITPDQVRRAYGVETEVFDSPGGSPTLSLVRPMGLAPVFSRSAASVSLTKTNRLEGSYDAH